eukprot:TRINITY_DN3321_c0_g1_i2.p4 TRINITY_DN3321_c0_g1~~TRINITY_DN3321_c0_g1_i2.p4  ORF type:complete len:133 (-),score=17.76 TRINITY_DN3321_c0_g1_i2:91-489(-)
MGGIYLVHHYNKGYITQKLINYFKNTMCSETSNAKFTKACNEKWYNDAFLVDNTLLKCQEFSWFLNTYKQELLFPEFQFTTYNYMYPDMHSLSYEGMLYQFAGIMNEVVGNITKNSQILFMYFIYLFIVLFS